MTDEPTEPIEPSAPGEPSPWVDFEPARAQELITKLRQRERNAKNNMRALGLSGEAIRRVLELENNNDEPVVEPAAVTEVKALKMHAAVLDAIHDAGADRPLTLAALKADGALDDLDDTSDSLRDDLADLVDTMMARYPALRTRTSAPAVSSGAAFPGGSGGGQSTPPISREALSFMTPQQIDDARRAGLLSHLGVGGD